jgi:hypothetical protein
MNKNKNDNASMERGTHCCSTTMVVAHHVSATPPSHQQANKKGDPSFHHVSAVPDPRSRPRNLGEKKRREEEDPTHKQQYPKRAAYPPQPLKAPSLPSLA